MNADTIERARRALVSFAGGGFEAADIAAVMDAALALWDAAAEYDAAVQRISVVEEISEEWHRDYFEGRARVQGAREAVDRAIARIANGLVGRHAP